MMPCAFAIDTGCTDTLPSGCAVCLQPPAHLHPTHMANTDAQSLDAHIKTNYARLPPSQADSSLCLTFGSWPVLWQKLSHISHLNGSFNALKVKAILSLKQCCIYLKGDFFFLHQEFALSGNTGAIFWSNARFTWPPFNTALPLTRQSRYLSESQRQLV